MSYHLSRDAICAIRYIKRVLQRGARTHAHNPGPRFQSYNYYLPWFKPLASRCCSDDLCIDTFVNMKESGRTRQTCGERLESNVYQVIWRAHAVL